MRRWIATRLLRLSRSSYNLACRVYPPKVTEESPTSALVKAIGDAVAEAARRESRGWN